MFRPQVITDGRLHPLLSVSASRLQTYHELRLLLAGRQRPDPGGAPARPGLSSGHQPAAEAEPAELRGGQAEAEGGQRVGRAAAAEPSRRPLSGEEELSV